MIKKLGIPKEIKQDEGRVALIPEHITQFTGLADIFVETQAGVGSGFTDEDYKQAGAKIVSSAEELYGTAQIICKVKEPQPEEFELLNSDHVLFWLSSSCIKSFAYKNTIRKKINRYCY